MQKIVTLSLFVLIFTFSAFADIARPKPPKPAPAETKSRMIFISSPDINGAVLRIPEHEIRRLAAELDGNDSASVSSSSGSTTLMISAAFLSLAFVFGGIWLVRSGKIGNRSAAAAFLIFAVVGGTVIAYANVAPRRTPKPLTVETFNKNIFTNKNYVEYGVKIETGGSVAVLAVPASAEKENKKDE